MPPFVSGSPLALKPISDLRVFRVDRPERRPHASTATQSTVFDAVPAQTEGTAPGSRRDRQQPRPYGGPAALPRAAAAPQIGEVDRAISAALIRAQRLDTLLTSVADWSAATGTDRVNARRAALHDIAQFRRLHLLPERAAFNAAVAANKRRTAA